MSIKLKRGFDINLAGKAKAEKGDTIHPESYIFKPTDFMGIKRPKVMVKEGDEVKAGTPIFFDKLHEQVKFTAPVSGRVSEVIRGAKRKPLGIKIEADREIQYVEFDKYESNQLSSLSKEQIIANLSASGVWPNIIERPYGIVANPQNTPKSIFISGFDSSPLAPDYDFIFKDQGKYLQAGVDVLSKLTSGKVHLSTEAGVASVLKNLTGVQKHEVKGKHPAGNVGVQIHHIDPINKGEVVWTTTPYGLQQIGKLFLEGRYDAAKTIAVAGSELKTPCYYDTHVGAIISGFLQNNLKQDNVRVIAGNVLTGEKIEKDGAVGYYNNLISVIPEGDQYEFLGWITPGKNKLSMHRSIGLLSFLTPKKEYALNTNMRGEERAFVQTGVFEKVVPMDIYPVYLLKAIMANDFEEMEALGIYEVIEEDLALCEFVDVSKIDVQAILREGINSLMDA